MDYRIYLIGLDGYLIGSIIITSASDEDALRKASGMPRMFHAAIEIWRGSRKVGHLDAAPVCNDAAVEQK